MRLALREGLISAKSIKTLKPRLHLIFSSRDLWFRFQQNSTVYLADMYAFALKAKLLGKTDCLTAAIPEQLGLSFFFI